VSLSSLSSYLQSEQVVRFHIRDSGGAIVFTQYHRKSDGFLYWPLRPLPEGGDGYTIEPDWNGEPPSFGLDLK
jgi:hypothetical protein